MNSNAFTAADMSTAAANGHHDGYQAGYADAVKAFDAAQPAAAQEAVAWSKTKPTAEGAYYVRGFNLFQLAQYEALVQVRTHHFDGEPAPELVCNIHESTSNADKDDWSPIVEMSEDFEWLGPLVVAPAAAAPEWQPIETAPEGRLVVVGWLDTEDSHYPENYEFDYLEGGLWAKHEDCVEHAHAVAPPGSQMPKEQPPYQWWMDLPAFPAARPQGVKDV